ncbi:MAG: butyrate kinase [Rikenellaceae bacterium]
MGYTILAIDPGSTSTKVALYNEEQPLLELAIDHSDEELSCYDSIVDQFEWRQDLILYHLESEGVDISQLSAVVGRGGIIKPVEGGVYQINDALWHDTKHARLEHASNLGALIARAIADQLEVPAYIADPVVLDEMEPLARISGLPESPRQSIFHALNTRATARIHATSIGRKIEEINLILVHMGGGVTVSLHSKGRVVDTFCGLGGDGTFSPERAGRLASSTLIDMCFSGEYTYKQMQRKITGKGGFAAHLGTSSVMEVMRRVKGGDIDAKLIVDAFCYNVAKDIGALATVVGGQIDGIILTGGVAHNNYINIEIEKRCCFIAPVYVYAGENELQALAMNALAVLRGQTVAKVYGEESVVAL